MADQTQQQLKDLMAAAGPKMNTITTAKGKTREPGEVVVKVSGNLAITATMTGVKGASKVTVEKVD